MAHWSKSSEFGHDADVVATVNQLFPGGGTGAVTTASSQWAAGGYEPAKATDGDTTTRWNAADLSGGNQWLEVDFTGNRTFNKTITREAFGRVTSYSIQYWNGASWSTCFTGSTIGAVKVDSFATVTASRVRLYIASISSASASIYEFEVHL
jgi:alpha-L-fucosidase